MVPTIGQFEAAQLKQAEDVQLGVMDQLQLRRNKLTQELTEVDKAIQMFEEQPGLEKCLTQLSRVGVYR